MGSVLFPFALTTELRRGFGDFGGRIDRIAVKRGEAKLGGGAGGVVSVIDV